MKKHLLPFVGLLLVTWQALAATPIKSTSTTIASSMNASTVGAAVTFTATTKYDGFYFSGDVPEGTVTFQEGATVLAADVPIANGVATFTTVALTVGTHVITATYNGTSNYATSTGSIAQTVDDPGSCPTYSGNIAYVNASATVGTNNGTSWANAFLTLQEALDAACTCGVTQIWVAQGTYVPTNYPIGSATTQYSGGLTSANFSFHLVDGVAVYGGFNGSETLLSQRNWRQNPTILSGSNARNHVVTSISDGSSTRLDGFTVTGGNANGLGFLTVEGGSLFGSLGGGVFMYNSSLRLENLVVTGNAASSIGGIYATNGSPTLTNVAVLNHSTGGMQYLSGGTAFVITITNAVFAGNSTSLGGGLQVNGFNMTANLTNVVFFNNTASIYAGGLLSSACTTNLVNCTFFGNSAPEGGAMKNVNNSTVNDKNGIYYNNDVSTQSGSAFNATTTLTGTDPKFVNPADPDGPDNVWMTADDGLAIASNSPAVNAGTAAGAPATDIRGVARTGNPDQGAYEYNPCVTPTAFTVTGGGSYCTGGSGVAIGLSGSESGVSYQLKDGSNAVVATVPGSGSPISFGTFTATGTYTAVASRSETCTATMTGSAMVSVVPPMFTQQPSVAPNLTVCANGSVAFSFDVNCPTNATFTARLSDKDGDFTTPLTTWTVTPGSNSVQIPASAPSGNGYRIQVVGSNPALTSDPTDPFKITALSVNQLPTTPTKICQRSDALPVTFSTTGSCAFPQGNVFTVQLSSATGSFTNPTVLGTALPGTTTFPASALNGLPAGTGYRVRIVTTNPATTSSASLPFKLEAPNLNLTPAVGGAPVCRGNQVTVSFTLASCPFFEGNGFTAQLSNASGNFNSPVNLGPVTQGSASSVTIPAGTAAGTGYRIRVVSSNPVVTSSSSAAFQVKTCVNRLSAEVAELVISPNPVVGGEIRCRVSGMDNPHFSLTNPTGRGLGLSVKTDGSGEFVLTPKQALPVGVYVLQASEGTTRLTRRVLVSE